MRQVTQMSPKLTHTGAGIGARIGALTKKRAELKPLQKKLKKIISDLKGLRQRLKGAQGGGRQVNA
jgi:hypothetical protein